MDRKTRFSLAGNYALYYGSGKADLLAQYDIAIVEPSGHSVDSIQELISSGTLTIAYLSVMEIPPWSRDLGLLKASDFIHLDGQPYINREFGNFWADLRSSRWVDLLLDRANYLMEEIGYDGLFLDTIGYVESRQLPDNVRKRLISAASKIVAKLRKRFPGRLLIQNCGLEELLKMTAVNLDGVCWENPPLNQPASQEWASHIVGTLEWEKRNHDLQIFLLVEKNNPCANDFHLVEKVAYEKRFLVYKAPTNYIDGVARFWRAKNIKV